MPRDVVVRNSDGKTVDVVRQEAEESELNFNAKKTVSSTDYLIQQISYTAQGLVEYIGFAKPGTSTSSASWQIKKMVYSGTNVISILFADGDLNFDNVWDNRASLSYS